jgi:muconolactone D-isomerase
MKGTTMLYLAEIDVNIPDTIDPSRLEDLKAREKVTSSEYQRSGEWLYLWRIAGKFSNVSIFDVSDHDRLHEILWSLPLFPFMTIRVVPLARHPSAIDRQPN